MNLTIHTDGGALNNPGPAACAYVIHNKDDGALIKESSFYLGNQTNNVAEYMGIIHALEEVVLMTKTKTVTTCLFVSDSLLLVNQINGLYRVKQEHLKPLFARIKTLVNEVGVPTTFTHTLREGNVRADALVKKELATHS